MFSLKIVDSDAFLDMPQSSQLLYFHLGMRADDDGFVNPRKIMRLIGAAENDLTILLGKRFLLPFENGVVVIKHWLINNLIRKDFYQETTYLDQKKTLFIKENKAYTENVNNLSTQVRLGKDSIICASATPSHGSSPDNDDFPTGEEEDVKKPNLTKVYNRMLDELSDRRWQITGQRYSFRGDRKRHYKALKILSNEMKISQARVYELWEQLCHEWNDSEFLKQKGFDLYTVINRLVKVGA